MKLSINLTTNNNFIIDFPEEIFKNFKNSLNSDEELRWLIFKDVIINASEISYIKILD